jgi:DNA repair protein RadC
VMTNYLIKDLAPEDRPRERMMAYGPQALSTTELMAILIGSGNKEHSALDIARELTVNNKKIKELAMINSVAQLTHIPGLGLAKATLILAALELGKRIMQADSLEQLKISSPTEVAKLLMPRLRYEHNEHFLVVLLNSKNKVMALKQVSEGSLSSSIVHPREVFSPAVEFHAAAILVGHNHPSGDPSPSKDDKVLTEALVETGKILGIPLLDHVIVGDGRYYSFKAEGLL